MIISVINQKGGAGKTTTAVLCALALAAQGKRVLCIDTDPQGGLTAFLDPRHDAGPGLFDILTGGSCTPATVRRGDITVDLIPADHRLDKIYTTLRPFELEKNFKKTDYDFLIFDTPPTVTGITLSAAIISDRVFIPADLSRATLRSTRYTVEALGDIKKAGKVILIGYKEPKPGSHSFTAAVGTDFLKAFKGNIAGTIQRSVGIQKAVNDTGYRWTPQRREKILQPVLKLLGVL